MSTKRYVLRAKTYAYDDNAYRLDEVGSEGRFCEVYTDLETATAAWKKREQDTLSYRDFWTLDKILYGSNEALMELDKFVFDRCGKHISYDHIYADGSLQRFAFENCENSILKMSTDDIFEFLQKAGTCSYQLLEFDSEIPIYAHWYPEDDDYDYIKDSYSRREGSYELLLDSYFDDMCYEGGKENKKESEAHPYKLTGSLAELSHSPALLKSVIDNNPEMLEYDEQENVLHLKSYKVFKQVYPLLAKPPFEVRELSFEELTSR